MHARVTTDLAQIDLGTVHRWLSTDAFWALGRTREAVEVAAEASVNFGLLDDAGLRGYARLVTDRVTFGWLCDVYVDPAARGLGYGRALSEAVLEESRRLGLKRVLLITRDAHGLYRQVGFRDLPRPADWMFLDPREG